MIQVLFRLILFQGTSLLQWSMVKNPPANAGDTGLIPGLGTEIPYALRQLSLCRERVAPLTTNRESLLAVTKSPHATMKTQHSQK